MLPLLLALVPGDPTPIASRIHDVTVYGSSALVRRRAEITGAGTYVLQGLPSALDRDNVRVKCQGGDVVDIEVRPRVVDKVPTERVQALRDRILAGRRELKVLEDERSVLSAMHEHLMQLARLAAGEQGRDVQSGKASIDAWNASLQFLSQRTSENTKSMRESSWRIEEKQQALADVEAELGRTQGASAVNLYDVVVEIVAPGRAGLDVEYFVGKTGWQPTYDLRATSDLGKVEMTYRARVWQKTGEDWADVELSLSTARPQIGAQGPEPQPIWLSIDAPTLGRTPAAVGMAHRELKSLGYAVRAAPDAAAPAAPAPRPFASVEDQGLSVRFKLPRNETIESRELPTTVLVGASDLAIAPERVCVPALDPTVWLRAKAKNTSPWVLLPGSAAVFFGSDFLGSASIGTVQTGQELVLHLGADPGITVARTQTQDLSKGPGFLSTKSSRVESWRIRFENHGAVSTAKDGSVEVILQEVLPKSRDDRISVEISRAEPKPSDDERWKQDRDERGIQTWIVRVPKDGAADVIFETTVSFPKGSQITRQ